MGYPSREMTTGDTLPSQIMSSDAARNASFSSDMAHCGDKEVHTSISAPIIMVTFGIVGNMLALIVLYKTRSDKRRSAFYTLVAGLALTDLLGQLLTSPIAIVAYSRGLTLLETNTHLCSFHGFLMVAFGLATPLIVCLMALERISALCINIYGSNLLSVQRVRATLVISWLFSMCFAALPLLNFGCYERQYPCSWCFLKFHIDPLGVDSDTTHMDSTQSTNMSCGDGDSTLWGWHLAAAYACLYAVINLTVITITIISNIVVIVVLLRMRKRRRLLTKTSKQAASAKSSLRGDNREGWRSIQNGSPQVGCLWDKEGYPMRKAVEADTKRRRDSQQTVQDLELQMVWLVCGMTLTFTVCWTPFMCQILMSVATGSDKYSPSPSDMLALRLAAVNQILDPWLYIILRRSLFRKIRQGLLHVLHCCCPAPTMRKTWVDAPFVVSAPQLHQRAHGRLLNEIHRQPNGTAQGEQENNFNRTTGESEENEKLMLPDDVIAVQDNVVEVLYHGQIAIPT